MDPAGDGTVRSLAAAEAGREYEVERILFDSARELCADLGVHEGDRVTCRGSGSEVLVLENAAGRVVVLASDWARWVQVRG